MILLMFVDSMYDKYRLSGVSLSDFLSWFRSESPEKSALEKADDVFNTKFANILSKSETPQLKPSRIVEGTVKIPDFKITLLQYQTCPFCCKVRAFLDYYGLPYDVVEVNPVMRQQLKFSKGYRKVPIVLITPTPSNSESDAETRTLQINDSTLIISALTSYLLSRKPTSRHHNESLATMTRWYLNNQVFLHEDENENESGSDATFRARHTSDELVHRYFLMIGDIDPRKYERMDPPLAEERRWRRWVDDHFVHVLSPNIYRTFDEALRSFNYFSEVGEWEKNFSDWERLSVINVGAAAMYMVSKKLKKKYNLKEDVRESLYESCNYWLKGIGRSRQFLGGDRPNLADLAVYGALSSIEGCDAFVDLMNNTQMSKWYFAVKTSVQQADGSNNIRAFMG